MDTEKEVNTKLRYLITANCKESGYREREPTKNIVNAEFKWNDLIPDI